MFEYTVLVTFACIMAFFSLWMVRTAKTLGRKLYNAFLPSSKGNLKKIVSDDDLPYLSSELRFIAMPWGWKEVPQQAAAVLKPVASSVPPPIPWGWPGGREAEFRHMHLSMLQQLGRRLRQEAMMFEMPFAQEHSALTYHSRPLLTYFSDTDSLLHAARSEGKRKRGFQLPWGW